MRALLLCLLASLPAIGLESRAWTDSQNRKTEAALIRIDGENIVLKLKDGRDIPFPLAKLSQADRDYVESHRAALNRPPTEGQEEKSNKPLNFNAPWPERITFTEDPEIVTIQENPADKSFIYESANYRYVSDVRLSKGVVKGFAMMFEATNLYCATIPLSMNGGSPPAGKHQIILFEKMEDYHTAGGPAGTAGVFIGAKKAVLVPLESLGVHQVGSGYMIDYQKSSRTLPHELTHQLTPPFYFHEGAMGWFTEGLAEYIAVTPYRSGSYDVRGNLRPIIKYVTAYGEDGKGGRAIGTKIKLPHLRDFMLLPYEKFTRNAQISYGCGLLFTTYFLHLDGAGDGARLKAFLQALRAGKEGDDAFAALLDGRSFPQLEQEITKAWGKRGVDFTFGNGE